MADRETPVHIVIVNWLRQVLPREWRVHHSPNGGKRSKRAAAQFKEMGVVAGFPDIIALGPNRQAFFLEVKAPADKAQKKREGSVSESQRAFFFDLNALGWLVPIVHSIDEARVALKALGIITREAA